MVARRGPGVLQQLGEGRAVIEPWRLLLSAPSLGRVRSTRPHLVIAVPGLGATDVSMRPLRAYLERLGHDTAAWGLGRNRPDVEASVARFRPIVEQHVATSSLPVALVGWSLGGIVARETARELNEQRPGSIALVITYGTPVHGPRHSVARRAYTPAQLDRIDAVVAQRRRRPIGCPVVAVHSRNDGIVGAAACIDDTTPDVTNLAVRSTHFGMGLDPDVWRIVAEALDRPAHDAG